MGTCLAIDGYHQGLEKLRSQEEERQITIHVSRRISRRLVDNLTLNQLLSLRVRLCGLLSTSSRDASKLCAAGSSFHIFASNTKYKKNRK